MKIPTKIRKLLDPCKHVDIHVKKLFLPLVELAVKQHEDIKKLEDELRALRETTIFEPPKPYVREAPPPPNEPLESWLKRQFDEGQENSESFQRFLRYKKLTLEEARKLAFSY